MKSILHINIDSFCAVVEQMRRVDLRGRAVIVGRARGNTSGVVVSASREARKCGVEDGMGVRQACRSCPDAVVLSEDRGTYVQVFNSLLDILARYSPLLEPDLIGCAYLDVTGSRSLFGDAGQIASRISSEVRNELGLVVSIGIASNKLLARAASGSKRSGIVKVCIGFEEKFLSPMPVSALDSVNAKIAKRLGELGVSTIGQLAMIPQALLVRQFGPVGSLIARQSMGIDVSQVKAAYPPEIIIGEQMFASAIEEPAEVLECLRSLADDVVMRLRKRGGLAGEVMLEMIDERAAMQFNRESAKLAKARKENGWDRRSQDCQCGQDCKSARTEGVIAQTGRIANPPERRLCVGGDGALHSPLSALHCFKKPTDSASSVAQALERMLMSKMRPGMEIAQVKVVLRELTPGVSAQLCLIGDGERRQRLDRAVELLRTRFGDRSVRMAGSMA